jgi:hypothetical protein
LALAIMVTAVMVRSGTELHRARSDYERTRAEYALDGAAVSAEIALLQSRPAERYAWSLTNELGTFQVLAEDEGPKLAPANASSLDGEILRRIGVSDPAALQARLTGLAERHATDAEIAAADTAPGWRACGLSLVSPWGAQTAPHLALSVEPDLAGTSPRLGEVWRIRTTSVQGFTDDRIVRLTGDPTHPAAVVERRLYRTTGKGDTCDSFADGRPSA